MWGFSHNPLLLSKIQQDSAKSEFELLFKLRMSNKLVRWLIGLVASGTAATAVAHWLH